MTAFWRVLSFCQVQRRRDSRRNARARGDAAAGGRPAPPAAGQQRGAAGKPRFLLLPVLQLERAPTFAYAVLFPAARLAKFYPFPLPLLQAAGTSFAGRLEEVQEASALQQSMAEARQVPHIRTIIAGLDCMRCWQQPAPAMVVVDC